MTVLAVLALTPCAAADELYDYGRHLAAECVTCHRLDGTTEGIPAITGWDPALFVDTLKAFKSGARSNPTMVAVARSLDEEQMQALAAYFGKAGASEREEKPEL